MRYWQSYVVEIGSLFFGLTEFLQTGVVDQVGLSDFEVGLFELLFGGQFEWIGLFNEG